MVRVTGFLPPQATVRRRRVHIKVRREVRRTAGPSTTRLRRCGRDDGILSVFWAVVRKRSNEESEHIHYGMHAKQQQGRGSGEVNLKKVRGSRYERKAKNNRSKRRKPKANRHESCWMNLNPASRHPGQRRLLLSTK